MYVEYTEYSSACTLQGATNGAGHDYDTAEGSMPQDP